MLSMPSTGEIYWGSIKDFETHYKKIYDLILIILYHGPNDLTPSLFHTDAESRCTQQQSKVQQSLWFIPFYPIKNGH